jgi:hypothetical protein
MFAIIAAIIFALELLFEFVGAKLGSITTDEMTTAGLMFFALHFAHTGGWGRGSRR